MRGSMKSQSIKLAEKTRLTNEYRREAREKWALASPFRQSLYIKARFAGKSPEEAIACSRGDLRK